MGSHQGSITKGIQGNFRIILTEIRRRGFLECMRGACAELNGAMGLSLKYYSEVALRLSMVYLFISPFKSFLQSQQLA